MTEASHKPSAVIRRVKQHIRGRSHRFFAVCHPGFEEVTRRELEDLDISGILEVTTGGILFSGKIEDCYRVNLMARTVTRLLLRITSFNVLNFSTLNSLVKEIPWELYLPLQSNLSFSITARKSRLHHTDRIEEECRDAITSRLKPFLAEAPEEKKKKSQQIFIRLYRDRCTISIDSSGELLYRRGQRVMVNEAPLRETRAAAILLAADFSKYRSITDAMCGAGTFSIEAAAMAAGIPAGINRSFAFQGWPVYGEAAFNHMKEKYSTSPSNPEEMPQIVAGDIDEKSLEAALENLDQAGLDNYISVRKKDFFNTEEYSGCDLPALLLLNPPYGKRLDDEDTLSLYRRIGKTIKNNYADFGFAIIVPGHAAEAALNLDFDKKITFKQGGIPVAVLIKNGF